jgi:hypothetical protein
MKSLLALLLLTVPTHAQLSNIPKWEQLDPSGSSTTLRKGGRSYIHGLQFSRPTPATTAAQLTTINPALPKILPDFAKLMESAEVSSNFAALYDRKIQVLKKGDLLTSHNYYDCETVLRLAHPDTGRKVLLLQADMDVVTDGSDPGRAPNLADYNLARSSDWFLPETAFSWHKSGGKSNPFLSYYPETLTKLQALRTQLEEHAKADPGVVWRELLQTCDEQIYRIKERGLHNYTKTNLRERRFLLADRDPFVVLPVPWVKQNAAWSAKPGDYAAVIYKDKIYPALLGDAGPSDKVGEASLYLARELNPKANGKTRAISDLTVTYLFFPKTATKAQSPDLALWHQKVTALLTDLGGLGQGITLHQWAP